MNEGFADWYRAVSIEPKADELQKRWQGVEQFATEASRGDLPLLTALFFKMPVTNDAFLGKFRSAFKQFDDAFPMQRNDAELQVLGGATLVKLFEYGDGWGLAAALQLVCAYADGWRPPIVPGIVAAARSHLRDASAELRTAADESRPGDPAFKAQINAVKAACQANALPNLAGPLTELGEAVERALQEVVAWAKEADRRQDLFREESNVLWWLVGGHSRDLGLPFNSLKEPSACLIAAKELADLVRILPGPFAADAFLDSVLRQAHPTMADKVTLAAAVDACPPGWHSRFLGVARAQELTGSVPVHLAIQKALEGGKGWAAAFQRTSRLKASEKWTPLSLALQTYQEILLTRAMQLLEKTSDG